MGVLLINTVLLIVMIIVAIVLCVIGVIVGFNLGVAHRKKIAEAEFGSAEEKAKSIVKDAEKAADAKKRELLLEAKEENQKLRADFDAEVKERRNELNRQERRINQKEENLDKKTDNLEKKEQTLSQKLKSLESKEKEIAEIKEQQMALIEKISGLTAEEAKTILLKDVENQTKHEAAMMVKEIEQEAKENAEKKAKNIVSLAIQKVAADHVAETTVSVVNLPSDEMKGRIIGREGRNIRTIETLTGVDLIIDDTPEAVIVSSFDPIRREVARSLRLTKRVLVSLWKQLLSLVSRLTQNFTSVSAVNTAATHHQLSSATRLVLTMFHAHHSVCQSQDLQLLKLRLTKKTNSLSNMIIRQAKPFGFACFFIRNSLLHLIYFKKFSKNY